VSAHTTSKVGFGITDKLNDLCNYVCLPHCMYKYVWRTPFPLYLHRNGSYVACAQGAVSKGGCRDSPQIDINAKLQHPILLWFSYEYLDILVHKPLETAF